MSTFFFFPKESLLSFSFNSFTLKRKKSGQGTFDGHQDVS